MLDFLLNFRLQQGNVPVGSCSSSSRQLCWFFLIIIHLAGNTGPADFNLGTINSTPLDLLTLLEEEMCHL